MINLEVQRKTGTKPAIKGEIRGNFLNFHFSTALKGPLTRLIFTVNDATILLAATWWQWQPWSVVKLSKQLIPIMRYNQGLILLPSSQLLLVVPTASAVYAVRSSILMIKIANYEMRPATLDLKYPPVIAS